MEKPKLESSIEVENGEVSNELEETLIALTKCRTEEFEHLRNRLARDKSQLEEAEKRLEDTKLELERYRSRNRISTASNSLGNIIKDTNLKEGSPAHEQMVVGDDSLQSIGVRLDGKNYSYWSYVMKNFLRGKQMWNYVSGITVAPKTTVENYAELLKKWDCSNSKIITWINNSVDIKIGMQLTKYDTAKEVWDYLERLFKHPNTAIRYQLEGDIRALSQNDRSIREFYADISALWDQLAMAESAELKAFEPFIVYREELRIVQMLMALRPEYEHFRVSVLHRIPLPSIDSIIHELLAEETRLKTQTEKGSNTPSASVLAAPAQQNRSNAPRKPDCNYCKQLGHWKNQCPKLARQKANGWKSGDKSQQQHRGGQQRSHFTGQGQPRGGSPHLTAALVHPGGESIMDSFVNPTMDSLTKQFQRFLASQSQSSSQPVLLSQHYAMSTRSTSSFQSLNGSGSQILEADWDMP